MTTAVAEAPNENHDESVKALKAVLEHAPLEVRQALQSYYYAEWQRHLYVLSQIGDVDAMRRTQGVARFLEQSSAVFTDLAQPATSAPAKTLGRRRTSMSRIA